MTRFQRTTIVTWLPISDWILDYFDEECIIELLLFKPCQCIEFCKQFSNESHIFNVFLFAWTTYSYMVLQVENNCRNYKWVVQIRITKALFYCIEVANTLRSGLM